MAWSKPHKKHYYYRSQRINGQRVNQYVGRGPAVAHALQAQAAQQAAERAALLRCEQTARQLDANAELLRLVTAATLILNGYHKHKNQWRKKRVKPDSTSTPSNPNH